MFWQKPNSTRWSEIFLLSMISGLVYLPRVGGLGYSKFDDWYFIYDSLVVGSKVFLDITRHTRPIRGPLYQLYYSLFGLQPLPYHLAFFLWRLAGGLGVLWLCNLLWPRQRQAGFFIALLFLLFPGFLMWVGGLAFQPYIVSVCIQVFSIVFTLKAIQSTSMRQRFIWTLGAILSGWVYLALVEFAIGMELLRVLCVYLYVRRENDQLAFKKSTLKTIRVSLPFFLIPLGFVLWYQFLFENWRKAQEAGTQLGRLLGSPLTVLWGLVRLFQSTLNVTLLAWTVPFSESFFMGRLADMLIGVLLAAIIIWVVWWANKHLDTADADDGSGTGGNRPWGWQGEALSIGLLGTIGGVLPIVLANRTVNFGGYSSYSLPASLAGAIFVGGLVYSISSRTMRLAILSLLIGAATLTHQAVALQAISEERAVSEFWWQVSWRAPAIRAGTMLVVVYPNVDYSYGNELVWGPANAIYFPGKQEGSPVRVPLAASPWEPGLIANITMGAPPVQKLDEIISDSTMNYNYRNILVLTQPDPTVCVHVMDSRWPELSTYDDALVIAAAPKSRIGNIVSSTKPAVPDHTLFGAEPPHDWCYYYQQAEMARQQGNWAEVARLGDEIKRLGLHPNDQIEWLPFLQARAILGDAPQVRDISKRINIEPFYKYQACQILTGMAQNGYPLTPEMDTQVRQLFCPGGS